MMRTDLKVLMIHPALPPYRLDFFNALAESTDLELVFLSRNVMDQEFDQQLLRNSLRVSHRYLDRGFNILGRTFRLGIWTEIARSKPDVVVTAEFSPTTLAVALGRSLGVIDVKHVVWTDDNPQSVRRDSVARRMLRRRVLPKLDGILTLSEPAEAMYHTEYGFDGATAVCPILHNEDHFRRSLMNSIAYADSFAERYSLAGKRVVLYVGRLASVKRLDRLIHAFSAVRIHQPGLVLVLVGDGPEEVALKACAARFGVADSVVFPGRFDGLSLRAWYLLGSVFALTSSFERFGAVVNEALLAGLPVICSDQAGAQVLIRNDENGTVVDASDPFKLEQALASWIKKTDPVSDRRTTGTPPSLMYMKFDETVEAGLRLLQTAREL